jgi:hypothetical protein
MSPPRRAAVWLLTIVGAVLAGGCGSSSPPTLHGDPGTYLLTPAQLPSPDFTVYLPTAPVGAGWLDPSSSAALQRDGLVEAAQVEYYRPVPFATSNGPITLTAAAARFSGAAGAEAAMEQLDTALDARSGATPAATGPLGDAGHAVSTPGALGGVPAIEIIVVWRVENVLNSLTAEGRSGGLLLDQLLPLARTETATELRG